ncbi:hypothetical protein T484DRAFT_1865920, partial [Baffinella frigidus]
MITRKINGPFLETYKFLTPYLTHSNFVLCEVVGVNAAELHRYLRYKGILTRYFGTQ